MDNSSKKHSYPRINGGALGLIVRIKGGAFTHKRWRTLIDIAFKSKTLRAAFINLYIKDLVVMTRAYCGQPQQRLPTTALALAI